VSVNPFVAGALGRCPNCGQGRLFSGYLKVAPACPSCGFDLTRADSGDGPAVFVIMVVGFLVVFAALFAEIAFHPPIWLHLVLWLPLIVLLSLGLLPVFKGLMIAAQLSNRASEARSDDVR
jgi:uncharacterized protein (DUF983 family)